MKRKKAKQPHWTEHLTKEDIVINCEWTRAQCEANLEHLFKRLFKLEERVRFLEAQQK